MILLDSIHGGGGDNYGWWCHNSIMGLDGTIFRSNRRIAKRFLPDTALSSPRLFFKAMTIRTVRHRKFVIYYILQTTAATTSRKVRHLSVRKLYNIHTRVLTYASFSQQKSMRFGRVAIGSSTNDNLLYIIYTHWSVNVHAETWLNVFPVFPKQL